MKEIVKNKLDKIASIWNHFILEYDFCQRKIKLTSDLKTNYFGDILGYFQDTFDLIFDERKSDNYSDQFSNHISLLQSVYVQQDFIEELLLLFKCRIVKGELKKDINYSINRDIRNELVGHPIRKLNGELISSCLFGYNEDKEKIVYLRYHKDNGYKFQSMEFPLGDLRARHEMFLNTYFDIILKKLRGLLFRYLKEIENLEGLIERESFEKIIELCEIFFESIFRQDYIYNADSLKKIHSIKDSHSRYQNLIDKFYFDLKRGLSENKSYVRDLFEPKEKIDSERSELPLFNFIPSGDVIPIESQKRKAHSDSYHYELGKLGSKRNPEEFRFHSRTLRRKCENNKIILTELNHMEINFDNDMEYYCALRLICMELKEISQITKPKLH